MITGNGFVTQHSYAPGSFRTNWNHIAGDAFGNFLFYDPVDGEAAGGQILDGGFTTLQSYGPGSFGVWTHIAGSQ